ncbi:MAG TPA: YbfB/YjiJ family MFS transporter [Pseudoduganella sp.]
MSNHQAPTELRITLLALALSMGAAISLGLARFAYGLLLPVMRADLGWSYALAGAMNTANAIGYLLGALITPALMRRYAPARVMMAGAVAACVFLGLSGCFVTVMPWFALRLLAGVASALAFIGGGLLAARLGAQHPRRSGLLIGLYYGGSGLGIVASALLAPLVLRLAGPAPHGWTWAWWALAIVCVLAAIVLAWPARVLDPAHAAAAATTGDAPRFHARPLAFALTGYLMFGVGYIGYMTFVIALLREQGAGGPAITLFYSLLGAAVVGSARLWSGLLDRHHDGRPMAILNGLLGIATILPALTASWPAMLLSGVLFGAVFLSVVASTTALVRHNLPAAQWPAGIGAFTIIFAAGQIVGPLVVGWISDGPGGLERGLVVSALALWLGALLAIRQKALQEK